MVIRENILFLNENKLKKESVIMGPLYFSNVEDLKIWLEVYDNFRTRITGRITDGKVEYKVTVY